MSEIWIDGEKVGVWDGELPAKGDTIPVSVDGEEYDARVVRVFKKHNKHTLPTKVIEVEDPRPMPAFFS